MRPSAALTGRSIPGKKGIAIDKINEQKKRWLYSYRAMEHKIQRILEELEQWKSKAQKVTRAFDGVPGGGGGDLLPQCVGKIMELEEELNAQIDRMVDKRREIEEAIARVPNPQQQEVLSLRYIDGLSWERIAERLFYSVQHIHKLHGRALQVIQIPASELNAIECDSQPMV